MKATYICESGIHEVDEYDNVIDIAFIDPQPYFDNEYENEYLIVSFSKKDWYEEKYIPDQISFFDLTEDEVDKYDESRLYAYDVEYYWNSKKKYYESDFTFWRPCEGSLLDIQYYLKPLEEIKLESNFCKEKAFNILFRKDKKTKRKRLNKKHLKDGISYLYLVYILETNKKESNDIKKILKYDDKMKIDDLCNNWFK